MLLIRFEGQQQHVALLERLGFEYPSVVTPPDESGQVMSKAADHIVSIADIKDGWISLWGQYDFNMLTDVSAKTLVTKIPEATALIYYAIEGTSGGLIYEHFEQGSLVHSYVECEGEIDEARCIGGLPPRDKEFGQVDEWALLSFAMPSNVSYEDIQGTQHVHYRVATSVEKPQRSEEKKSWWKIW